MARNRASRAAESFDRPFFDRFYRNPAHRVRTSAELTRHAALAVAGAEYILGRRVNTVLDIGCGEGEWGRAVRAIRPRVKYAGIEASEYVVKRFGAKRNIRSGSFGALREVPDIENFDLILCVDVLHYLPRAEVLSGANALGERMSGVALLHVFARADEIEGDVGGIQNRQSEAWYRRTFAAAGLASAGLGFWVGRELADDLPSLERMPG